MEIVTNKVGARIEEKSLGDYLAQFDRDVHHHIIEQLNRDDVDGCVHFINMQMDSSAHGSKSSLIYGPGCTRKTLEECLEGHLHDLPSQRQYPTMFYRKASTDEAHSG